MSSRAGWSRGTTSSSAIDVRAAIQPAAARRTEVEVTLEAPGWRVVVEGLRPVPNKAARRLYDLCQTAADL